MPGSASDFTPYAERAKQQNADLLFVAWAGTLERRSGAPSASRASRSVQIATGLAERATWSSYVPGINFLSHYVYNAPKNPVNDWLVKKMKRRNQLPGHLHAGRLRGRADDRPRGAEGRRRGRRQDDQGARGLEVPRPEGPAAIRPEDHAMLQPMFQVRLRTVKGKQVPVPVKTFSPGNVQPPIRPFPANDPSTLQPRGTHPGDAEPRARHRRRDHRRRCRPGGRSGEFLGIIGPNGAGKTSLFNLLSGLYRPTHGTIEIAGRTSPMTRPTGAPRPDWDGRSRSPSVFRG